MAIVLTENFDATSIGSNPTGWAQGGSFSAAVQTAPAGLSGRSMRITQGTSSDTTTKTHTRQTGLHYFTFKLKTGGVTNRRYGDVNIYDGANRAVRMLFTTITVGSDANALRVSSGGTYSTPTSLAQSTVYTVIVALDSSNKKWKFTLNGVAYDNGGSWYSFDSASAAGSDTFTLDAASSEGATAGEYTWLDDYEVWANPLERTYTSDGVIVGPPDLYATGTHQSTACGCDEYSIVTLVAECSTAGSPSVYRSNDGSSWNDVTTGSTVTVSNISGNNYKIIDKRPQYGSGSTTYGGTVYYRVKQSSSPYSSAVSLTADVDKATVRSQSYATLSTIMGGSAIVSSSSGNVYVGEWCMAMARAYWKAGTAQYLTDTMAQHTEIATYLNADNILKFPDYNTYVYRDHHARTAAQLAVASRCLLYAGSTTNSQTLLTTADNMAKAAIDKLAQDTATMPLSTTFPNGQTAWSSGSVAAGLIRRPTSTNGRQYRAMNAGTNTTEPTWPTTAGGTVTHQGVTWKEMTVTASLSFNQYNPTSPYAHAVGGTIDPNQLATDALMYALLVTDSRSAFYSAGAYRTAALARITDNLKLVCAAQSDDGSIPLRADILDKDTLYAGYTLLQMTGCYSLLGAFIDELPLYVQRLYLYLESRTGGSTEPLTRTPGTGGGSGTTPSISELSYRPAAARAISLTSAIDKVPYSAAFWIASSDKAAGGYAVTGATSASPDYYQATPWEADVYIDGILGVVSRTYTSDGYVISQPTRTYTSDGTVVARTSSDYTSDGVIVSGTAGTRTTTYTSDGVIKATMTRSYTADGYVATASPTPPDPPADPNPAYRMFFDLSPFL